MQTIPFGWLTSESEDAMHQRSLFDDPNLVADGRPFPESV